MERGANHLRLGGVTDDDDSQLLVDGMAGRIRGSVSCQWVSPGTTCPSFPTIYVEEDEGI